MLGFFLARQAEQAIGAHHNNYLRTHPPGPRKPPQNPGLLVVLEIIGFGIAFVMAGYNQDLAAITPLFVIAPLVIGLTLLATIAARGAAEGARMRPNKDSIRRMSRTANLLKARCPTCHANYGQGCTATADKPYAIVDAKWNLNCHFTRVQEAVKLGRANREDVIAQFGGQLPKGLTL